jgi:hypothetical protein
MRCRFQIELPIQRGEVLLVNLLDSLSPSRSRQQGFDNRRAHLVASLSLSGACCIRYTPTDINRDRGGKVLRWGLVRVKKY